MSIRADALLRQLSGLVLSSQNPEDANRGASRIPIIAIRASKSIPLHAKGSTEPKPKERTTEITPDKNSNHLEDSGYESPDKGIDAHESNPQEGDNVGTVKEIPATESSNRCLSAPASEPKMKPSRIPSAGSSIKLRLKRTSSHSLQKQPTEPPKSADSSVQLNSKTSYGDQGHICSKKISENLTEENFLHSTRSGCVNSAGMKGQNESIHRRAQSKSLQALNNPVSKSEDLSKCEGISMPPPLFTSTPQKKFSREQFLTSPNPIPSLTTLVAESESFQEMKAMVDHNVSQILSDGQKEFEGKHSDWIHQVFNLQLEKIYNRLKQAFTLRLNESIEQHEAQLLEMKYTYRTKFLEFEETIKKFQSWYDEVLEENQKQVCSNEILLTEIQQKERSLRKDFQDQLETRVLQLEYDFEFRRQKALKKHAEQLNQLTEKHEKEIEGLVSRYEHQIEFLKKELEISMATNATLDENIEKSVLNEKEHEEMRTKLLALEVKAQEAQKEKDRLIAEHAQEITKLQEQLDANNENLNRLVKETRETLERTHAERERTNREMRAALLQKEEEYKNQIAQLTDRYGTKIQELTQSVQLLQSELLVDE